MRWLDDNVNRRWFIGASTSKEEDWGGKEREEGVGTQSRMAEVSIVNSYEIAQFGYDVWQFSIFSHDPTYQKVQA